MLHKIMTKLNVACNGPLQKITKSQLGHFCTMAGLGSKDPNVKQQHYENNECFI